MALQGVLAALAGGAYRDVKIVLEPAQDAIKANKKKKIEAQPAKPEVALIFKIRKLDSQLLAEQGIAVLFTDLPTDMTTLLSNSDDAIASIVNSESATDERKAAAADLQKKIDAMRSMGPKFFKQQAKYGDAVICAGVVAVWQPWNGPDDHSNPPPKKDHDTAEEAGGYWQPCTFTLGTPDPERGRFPLQTLGKASRSALTKEINLFSANDGEIADAMRSFR